MDRYIDREIHIFGLLYVYKVTKISSVKHNLLVTKSKSESEIVIVLKMSQLTAATY